MAKGSAATVSPGSDSAGRVRQRTGRLHNFGSGIRWIVRPDGECYGSFTNNHEWLARCAGYRDAEQAYAKGALKAHYDPATNTIRVEATKATPIAIALAKQIIHEIPASVAHVSIGEGEDFRSYMGDPRRVAARLSPIAPIASRTDFPNFACAGMYAYAAEFGT